MSLNVGDKAPDFKLVDTDRKERSLSEFLGKKTVLAFFPGAFTGVCTKEMCTLRDSMSNLSGMNAHIVGISFDSPFANKGFADVNKITYPLLSDVTRTIAKQYCGIVEDFAGVKGLVSSKRAVYVLDAAGVVKYAWVAENPGIEPTYDEVTKAVASF